MGSNKKLYGYYEAQDEWLPIKVDVNGKIIISTFPILARAYRSSTQFNLISSQWTKILLDVETYDVGSNFANYKFTASVGGYYFVTGRVTFLNPIAVNNYSSGCYKNGTRIMMTQIYDHRGENLPIVFTDIVYLDVGDYVELYACQYTGQNTLNIYGTTRDTYLVVKLLRV